MIFEDIEKLISDTPRKKKDTPEPHMFEESVKPPPPTIYTVNITKPEEHSPVTTWKFESIHIIEAN